MEAIELYDTVAEDPKLREILGRFVREERARRQKEYFLGLEWCDVPAEPRYLSSLAIRGILLVTNKSNKSIHYVLDNLELTDQVLRKLDGEQVELDLKELVCLVNDEMDSMVDEYTARLNTISAEIDNVNQRLERLYDALETGSLKLADLAPRIQHLRQHLEQLNATRLELEYSLSDRKVELADEETVKNYVDDLKNILEESTLTERKSFIKSFVREVKVKGSEVSLSYIPPLLSGMTSRETVLVPSIVHDGGQ